MVNPVPGEPSFSFPFSLPLSPQFLAVAAWKKERGSSRKERKKVGRKEKEKKVHCTHTESHIAIVSAGDMLAIRSIWDRNSLYYTSLFWCFRVPETTEFSLFNFPHFVAFAMHKAATTKTQV